MLVCLPRPSKHFVFVNHVCLSKWATIFTFHFRFSMVLLAFFLRLKFHCYRGKRDDFPLQLSHNTFRFVFICFKKSVSERKPVILKRLNDFSKGFAQSMLMLGPEENNNRFHFRGKHRWTATWKTTSFSSIFSTSEKKMRFQTSRCFLSIVWASNEKKKLLSRSSKTLERRTILVPVRRKGKSLGKFL